VQLFLKVLFRCHHSTGAPACAYAALRAAACKGQATTSCQCCLRFAGASLVSGCQHVRGSAAQLQKRTSCKSACGAQPVHTMESCGTHAHVSLRWLPHLVLHHSHRTCCPIVPHHRGECRTSAQGTAPPKEAAPHHCASRGRPCQAVAGISGALCHVLRRSMTPRRRAIHSVNAAVCRPVLQHRKAAVRLLRHSLCHATQALRTPRGSHA